MPHDRYQNTQRLSAITFDTSSCRDDYRTRLTLIARDLKRLAPDILLLQNVFATADGRYNTAAHLARQLKMHCAFLPTRPKVRYLDGRPIYSHSGLAILSNYPMIATARVELPCDSRDGERIAQFADLDISGTRLLVANIQVSRLAGADAVRRHQIERLGALLAEAYTFDHIVVGGDFNAGPEEPALAPIQTLAGFAVAEAAPERSVDRLFALTRMTTNKIAVPMALTEARPILDRPDPATRQYAGDRAGLACDAILANPALRWEDGPESWAFGLQTAAE